MTSENLKINEVVRDTDSPEKKESEGGYGVEIVKGQDNSVVVESLQQLESVLSHDQPVTIGKILEAEKALESIKVNFCGEDMTIEKMQKVVEENKEIWEEVKNENYKHITELTYITNEIAECLLGNTDWLLLHKLTFLSDKQAEILSKYRGEYVSLPELASLSDMAIRHLSTLEGEKELILGLTSLTDDASEYLSKYCGKRLDLRNVAMISDTAAKNLAKFKGRLGLSGLKSISDSVAECLGEHEGELDLRNVAIISDEGIKKLSKHKGNLGLGLTSLSDEAAEALSKVDAGNLHLSSLTSISDAAIEHLSHFKGLLGLDKLKSITDEAARSLSKHRNVSLSGLEEMSDTAARYFAEGRTPYFPGFGSPIGLRLNAQVAKFRK